MGLLGGIKTMIRNWLSIQPAIENSITIIEPLSFNGNAIKNKIWYRGDSSELHQLYGQLDDGYVGRSRFWAAAPANQNIRKMHSGLPALIVDTLAYIVKSDMDQIDFDGAGADIWEEIEKKIDFTELVGDAIVDALVVGDGAFKISIDTDVSEYPLVEFIPGDRVDFERKSGHIVGVNFYTDYKVKHKTYRLKESYRKGMVTYKLFEGDNEVDLNTVPELAELKPVQFTGDYLMAVPLQIFKSPKFAGRGKSIFDTKTDDFDAFDEVISQWLDALREGRVQKYIPEDLIPRNVDTGELQSVNAFGTQFIAIGSVATPGEQAEKIQVVQPEIKYEAFLSTYTATLNLCLQGLVSPATLGIDVGKMASAEAQREKKDVTGHTRNSITGALERALPDLIIAILKTYDNMQSKAPGEYSPTVTFGEYGAPDFDNRIENIGKASTTQIMSIESQVEELWGNTKDDEWKEAEVVRIKAEKGILVEPDPVSPGADLNVASNS